MKAERKEMDELRKKY